VRRRRRRRRLIGETSYSRCISFLFFSSLAAREKSVRFSEHAETGPHIRYTKSIERNARVKRHTKTPARAHVLLQIRCTRGVVRAEIVRGAPRKSTFRLEIRVYPAGNTRVPVIRNTCVYTCVSVYMPRECFSIPRVIVKSDPTVVIYLGESVLVSFTIDDRCLLYEKCRLQVPRVRKQFNIIHVFDLYI